MLSQFFSFLAICFLVLFVGDGVLLRHDFGPWAGNVWTILILLLIIGRFIRWHRRSRQHRDLLGSIHK